jgi:acetyl-CoA synthetase
MFALKNRLLCATRVLQHVRTVKTRLIVPDVSELGTDKQVFRAEENEVYQVPARVSRGAHVGSMSQYAAMYERSLNDADAFWREQAAEHIEFFAPFTAVQSGSFQTGDIAWFLNGKLNVSYNALDRHVNNGRAQQIAIIWEGDEPGLVRHVTYAEALQQTCRLANVLVEAGVRKGDTVAIYLPNCPEAAFAMLACARIGALHSVVFAGFSASALADRIGDARSKVLITADEFRRGGRVVPLKPVVDEALAKCPSVTSCFVLRRSEPKAHVNMVAGRDRWLGEAMGAARPHCPPVWMDSEDPLFLLYTSGSTGRPKGVVHTQAGYLLSAAMTHKYTFDIRQGDRFACMADIGWITGHTYIVYGPLCNGTTTFMFESTPVYPDAGRYWDMVQRHKLTHVHTAPTAIRAVQKFGDSFVTKYDRSSLRILGSVGEPINPEAWRWYHDVVGNKQCSIVDTYWQTESGSHMLTPFAAATPQKPGAATLPSLGLELNLVDAHSGEILNGNGVQGVLVASRPWPSIARTIYGDHQRYLQTYMATYPGHYFTGDGATRDHDGYYWIGGRVDDVLGVAGHRLGTAEVESALTTHPDVAEAAVVGIAHELKGEAIFAYVVLKEHVHVRSSHVGELVAVVRKVIGPIATPEHIAVVHALPKTRSGKTVRRILRKIANNEHENLGDMSTLADPEVVEHIVSVVKVVKQEK